jgi:hypothetical protein
LPQRRLDARGPAEAFPPHPGDPDRRPARNIGSAASFTGPPGRRLQLGDIVVSVERAIDQARDGRGGQTGDVRWSAADAVNSWVSEKAGYDHGSNTCLTEPCGHYTQVVWRKSTDIGCARVVCDSGDGVFIICSYYPPGNFNGESPY